MKEYYVGMDIHKRSISYCVKQADGKVVREGSIRATRQALFEWADTLPQPWAGAMEATMFTGWIYDYLKDQGFELRVGHPARLKAIVAAKKKSDHLDARTLADLLRSNLFPDCYMAPAELRELRRVLRFRNLLVREATRLKNRTAGLLMEVGAQYDKDRLHGKRYFHDLLDRLDEVPQSVLKLLQMNRTAQETFEHSQKWLLAQLSKHPEISERVALLRSIPAIGEVAALTWVLEVGDPDRFPNAKHAISYCGLCGAYRESAGKVQRTPLSKQRNKHLQTVLIEVSKRAPQLSAQLAAVHQQALARGANANEATLAVARKLVAYLLCVDKTGRPFEERAAV